MRRFRNFSPSSLVLILLCLFIFFFRLNYRESREITWDVFGYYLPLPATFIYNDPLLNDRSWVDELNDEKHLSGTVYQISTTEKGEPMYFFLFGMSLFYSIFFFIGHFSAGIGGFPQDGFSDPYQISLVFGCMLYTFIGLYYLRKIMLYFSNERSTAIVLVMIVLGTNYAHHMTIKNLETVNVLFMLAALVIWNTIQWHLDYKLKNLLVISIGLILMALVKPSEILFAFFPILFGIKNRHSFRSKWEIIKSLRRQFYIAISAALFIALPQAGYWFYKTGKPIYDTYKNAGVGLDFLSPHIWNTLFSFRKGWLIYTPIMIFALIGFRQLYRTNKGVFIPVFGTFICSFFIVASWTEWWYGAGFSIRPMITYYTLLSIPLAFFIDSLAAQKRLYQCGISIILLFFIFLNQFQWWQLRNYILEPYRTTKEYYLATFLKSKVSEKERKLLLIERDFSGVDIFKDSIDYSRKTWMNQHFDEVKDSFYVSNFSEEFAFTQRIPYEQISKKDHFWVRLNFDYQSYSDGEPVLATISMERKEGAYGYRKFELEKNGSNWKSMTIYFLTPEIRNEKDCLKIEFWKRTPSKLILDNVKLTIFEKKN
jgi:hypothetical protein